ncbi:MAG TPA: GNAT family N-acetyltransferase [Coriobacteriia bacterium]|nr:GNAT family N-acetyltransferase [Coriobacteriia bacterium]
MADGEFINLTVDNLADEHIACIIRSRKVHPGIDAKKAWLAGRLREGHVFRKLNAKAAVFIEYAPLETAWVPIVGDDYLYIYCLWVSGAPKGQGYGKALMQYCLDDARRKGKSGVCMLGAKKQKSWLSDQTFARKYGFETVDTTASGYELLALSFDGTVPAFTQSARNSVIDDAGLVVYHDYQCPYICQYLERVHGYCESQGVDVTFREVDTLEKAKNLPCPFNNWAVFYKGNLETVNLTDAIYLERILKK